MPAEEKILNAMDAARPVVESLARPVRHMLEMFAWHQPLGGLNGKEIASLMDKTPGRCRADRRKLEKGGLVYLDRAVPTPTGGNVRYYKMTRLGVIGLWAWYVEQARLQREAEGVDERDRLNRIYRQWPAELGKRQNY